MSSQDGAKAFDPFNTNQNTSTPAEGGRRGKFRPPTGIPDATPQETTRNDDKRPVSTQSAKQNAKPFTPKQTESSGQQRQTPLISALPVQESAHSCVVCFEPIRVYSVFDCEHSSQFCAACVMKIKLFHVHSTKKGADRPLTELLNANSAEEKDPQTIDFQKQCHGRHVKCPACYTTQTRVVFTRDVNLTHADFFPLKATDKPRKDTIFNDNLGVYVDEPDLENIISKLSTIYCQICLNNTKSKSVPMFKTQSELKVHTESHHSVAFCTACVGACLCYSHELKYMTHSQLMQHYQKGDAATSTTTAIKPHPFCRFCKVPYFSNDELYAHLLSSHYSCKFCHSENFEFFRTSTALLEHMKSDHYVCDVCSTGDRVDDMVVFTNRLHLNQHLADVHKNKGVKKINLNELMNGSFDIPSSSDAKRRMRNGHMNAAAKHHDNNESVDVVVFINDYSEVREGRRREQEQREAEKQKKKKQPGSANNNSSNSSALVPTIIPSVTPGNSEGSTTVTASHIMSDLEKPRDILAESMYSKRYVGKNVIASMSEQEQIAHAYQLSMLDQQPVSQSTKALNASFAKLENDSFLINDRSSSSTWGAGVQPIPRKKNKSTVFTVRAVPGNEKNKSVFVNNNSNKNTSNSSSVSSNSSTSSSSSNVPSEWVSTGKKPKANNAAAQAEVSPWSSTTASVNPSSILVNDPLSEQVLRTFPTAVPELSNEKPRLIQSLCVLFTSLVEERLVRENLHTVYSHFATDHASLLKTVPTAAIKKARAAVNKEEVKLIVRGVERSLTALSTGERGVDASLDQVAAVVRVVPEPVVSALLAHCASLTCSKQDAKLAFSYAKAHLERTNALVTAQKPLMPTETTLVLNQEIAPPVLGAPLPKKETALTGKQAMALARKQDQERKAIEVNDPTATTPAVESVTKDIKQLQLTQAPSGTANTVASHRINDITHPDILTSYQAFLKNVKDSWTNSSYNAVYYFLVLAQCSLAALRANIKQEDICTSELLKIIAVDVGTVRNVHKQCMGTAALPSLNLPDIDRLFLSKVALTEVRNLVASFRTGKAVAAKGQSGKISKAFASFENKDLIKLWEYSCIMLKVLCVEKETSGSAI